MTNKGTSEEVGLPAGVTPRQAEALQAVRQHIVEDECSPSLDDLARRLGTSRTSAHQLVGHLKDKGCLVTRGGSYRNLVISDLGRDVLAAAKDVSVAGGVARG